MNRLLLVQWETDEANPATLYSTSLDSISISLQPIIFQHNIDIFPFVLRLIFRPARYSSIRCSVFILFFLYVYGPGMGRGLGKGYFYMGVFFA